MFDLGASELLLIVIVAVIVIGPKDLPLALRTAGRWIGKMRRLSSHFRSGLDAMIREAEMDEMESKWKAQNEKIMRQDPATLPKESEPTGALPSPPRPDVAAGEPAGDGGAGPMAGDPTGGAESRAGSGPGEKTDAKSTPISADDPARATISDPSPASGSGSGN